MESSEMEMASAASPPAGRLLASSSSSSSTRLEEWLSLSSSASSSSSAPSATSANCCSKCAMAAEGPKGGNHHSIYTKEQQQLVETLQDEDPALRLQDIQAVLRVPSTAPPSPTPSLTTIWRIQKAADFTTKQLVQEVAARNSAETKQKRKEWCEQVGPTLTAATAIFIDESPFSFTYTRTRGRSRRGLPAKTTTPAIRGKNHSVIAAISPSLGLLHYEIKLFEPDVAFKSKRKGSKKGKTQPKGVTREVIRNFLLHLFDVPAVKSSATPFTLVLDNASIHKGDIPDVIFQVGHTPIFLPPYSPPLNPIEYAFSQWKMHYRAFYSASEGEVDESIHKAATAITPADCRHYFEHAQSLHPKAVAMEDL